MLHIVLLEARKKHSPEQTIESTCAYVHISVSVCVRLRDGARETEGKKKRREGETDGQRRAVTLEQACRGSIEADRQTDRQTDQQTDRARIDSDTDRY